MTYEDQVIKDVTAGMIAGMGHEGSQFISSIDKLLRAMYNAGYNEAKREVANSTTRSST